MRNVRMVLGICLLIVHASCIPDTCTALGDTFQEIALDDVQVNGTGQLVVSFYIDALNALPERYFEDGTIAGTYISEEVDGFGDIESYVLGKERFVITFKTEALPLEGENKPVALAFDFRDRRWYVDCRHPGMSDSYHVLLKMEILNRGVEGFDLSSFEWSQYTAKGAL